MTVLGSKLPEPYFSWVVQSKQGFRRFRKCIVCHNISTTVEVPMATRDEPAPADCCPKHPQTKSVTLRTMTPTAAIAGNSIGQGVLKCISLGGVYRRRACRNNYFWRRSKQNNYLPKPPELMRCIGKDGKPTRWSTVELDSTGVVTRDVSICPSCGGRTRSYRGTKERMEAWRL